MLDENAASYVKLGMIGQIFASGSGGNSVTCYSESKSVNNYTYYDCGSCTSGSGKGKGASSTCIAK